MAGMAEILSLHDAVSNVSYAPVAVNLKLENAVQPDIPILMTSYGLDREPVSLARTGVPQAIASTGGRPKPSSKDGCTSASALP